MSRNSNSSRSKKSQSKKPYDVGNSSFVKRFTSRVSEYIHRSWFGGPDGEQNNVDHYDEVVEAGEEVTITHEVTREERSENQRQESPPQKRARTDFSTPGDHFAESNNLSISAIHNDIGEPSGVQRRISSDARSAPAHRAVAGPSGLHRMAVAGASGLHLRNPIASSTPAQPTRPVPVPPVFQRQQVNTEVNGDDLSDSSESTSGCSSLVPQGGRSDTEQQPRSNKVSASHTPSFLMGQRSLFAQSGCEEANPQPAAPNKRPSFDVSILSPQARPTSVRDKLDKTVSPFYGGKTCYGGASAYKKISPVSKMCGISYDSIVNSSIKSTGSLSANSSLLDVVSPRRIVVTPNSSSTTAVPNTSQSEPSMVTKRILDTMESLSSPVSDCSRIPLDDCGLGSPLKRKRIPQDLYDYHSRRPPSAAGPANAPLPVPNVQELMKMKKMQERILDTTQAARKLIKPKNKPAWGENNVSYSLRQGDSEESSHTNKIKNPKRKHKDGEAEYDMPEQVQLPNIALPITNLPKFDLGFTPSRSSAAPAASSDANLSFTFSSPIVVKSPSKNNFKLTSPTTPANSKPVNNLPEPTKLNWQSSFSKSTFSNIPKDTLSCNMSDGKHNGEPSDSKETKTLKPLSEMFKVDPNTWKCDACDLRNNNDATACIACCTKRPTSSNAAKTATAKTPAALSQLPLASSFGDKFSKSGKWECDGCMTYNDNAVAKCPCCGTANPKVSSTSAATSAAPAAPLSSFGDKFKKPANSWDCSVCMVVNTDATATSCISCQSPKQGTPSNTTPAFTFGIPQTSAKTTTTSGEFKFGCSGEEKEKLPSGAASFGSPKPFTFGVPVSGGSGTPTSTAISTPVSILSASTKDSTAKDSANKKVTFSALPPFTSPTSNKRTLASNVMSELTKLTKKSQKAQIVAPKTNEKPSPSFGTVTTDDKSSEPATKKMFNFNPVTSEANEKAPTFMFGSAAATSATTEANNFVFKPNSSGPTEKTSSDNKQNSALFNFGTPTTKSGTGFSSPSFGANAGKSPGSFGTVTTPAETKPAVSFVETPKAAAGSKSPMFLAAAVAAATNVKPQIGFGATTKPAATTNEGSKSVFGNTVPSFGVTTIASSKSTSEVTPAVTLKPVSSPTYGASNKSGLSGFSNAAPMFSAPSSTTTTLPAFGATASSATPLFGVAATTAAPMFGGSSIITTAAPMFGGSSTTTTAAPMFGSSKTTTTAAPMFGSSTTTTTAAPMFGSSTTTTTAAPMFGSSTTTTTAAPMFGGSSTTTTPATMFGSSSMTMSSAPMFGATPSTTKAVVPAFGTTLSSATATPAFGAGAETTSAPAFAAFGAPAVTTSAPSSTPMFGSPMFGATSSSTSVFGATAAAPMFGAPTTKAVSFGDAPKPGTGTTFMFGKSQPTANSSAAPPPAYPYAFGSTQNTAAPANVGGFSFGSNTGAPTNQAAFGFGATSTENKGFGFGGAAPTFPAVKAPEQSAAPMFGSQATPAFGATPASNPAPSFGAAPVQQQAFAFGSNQSSQPTPGFSFNAGQSTSAAPSTFMFGQQASTAAPAAAAVPPQFNPNIPPSFNFTGGTGTSTPIFSATPNTLPNPNSLTQQRRYKKAMRRIPQGPR